MISSPLTRFRLFAHSLGICGALWLSNSLPATAQNFVQAQYVLQEEKVWQVAEQPPTPEGGLTTFYEYTEDNLACPAEAKKKGIKGNVFVQFIVEKNGELSQIKVVKGLGYGCDEAVVNCLKSAPRWKPGKQEGKPVRVQKTMSIQIK